MRRVRRRAFFCFKISFSSFKARNLMYKAWELNWFLRTLRISIFELYVTSWSKFSRRSIKCSFNWELEILIDVIVVNLICAESLTWCNQNWCKTINVVWNFNRSKLRIDATLLNETQNATLKVRLFANSQS